MSAAMLRVDVVAGGVTFGVLVVPGASRDQIVGPHGDVLRVRVAAPPERGRANTALCRLLATTFGVRPGDVRVTAGASSRRKTVEITGPTPDRVRAALG